MKKRRSFIKWLLLAAVAAGLALLLYPAFSSRWNALRQSRAITAYQAEVEELDDARREELLAQAEDYNRRLAQGGGGFALSGGEAAEFFGLLGSSGGAVGYVEIPAIGLSLPLYLGSSPGVVQEGAGILEGGSVPVGGADTHAVLTGHRGLPSETLFTHLDRLGPGDEFSVHILGRTVRYQVERTLTVLPEEMEALAIQPGRDLCTLVTCTPYGINTHRLLVQGSRAEEETQIAGVVRGDGAVIDPRAVGLWLASPLFAAALLGKGRRKEGDWVEKALETGRQRPFGSGSGAGADDCRRGI